MKLPGNLGLKATSIKYISTGVAALGLLAFSAQANAADIYAPMGPAPFPVAAPLAPLWSGLYGGAHIGGAWADLSTHDLDSYWYGRFHTSPQCQSVSSLRSTEHEPVSQRRIRRRHDRL